MTPCFDETLLRNAPSTVAVPGVLSPHYAVRVFWLERIVGLTGCPQVPFFAGVTDTDAVRGFARSKYVFRVEWSEAVLSKKKLLRYSPAVMIDRPPTPGSAAQVWGWTADVEDDEDDGGGRTCVETLAPPWEALLLAPSRRERFFPSMSTICWLDAYDGAAWSAAHGFGFAVAPAFARAIETQLAARLGASPEAPLLERGRMEGVVQLQNEWVPLHEALARIRDEDEDTMNSQCS